MRSRRIFDMACVAAVSASAPVSAGVSLPTFATFSILDGNSGSLNGVNFTMSGVSTPGFGGEIQSLSMSGADWNYIGTQQGRVYNQNTASSFTITFDTAVTGLQFYLYYFRGVVSGAGGYDSYTFSESFTITGGLSNTSRSGDTLDTSAAVFASGVVSFTGPVTSLTITTTGTATGGDAGFTMAQSAAPPAVPGLAGLGTLAGVSLAGRRRRR